MIRNNLSVNKEKEKFGQLLKDSIYCFFPSKNYYKNLSAYIIRIMGFWKKWFEKNCNLFLFQALSNLIDIKFTCNFAITSNCPEAIGRLATVVTKIIGAELVKFQWPSWWLYRHQ